MEKEPLCFDRMRPEQVKACRERADIAFLPLGSLEWHGVHNPLGTDSLKSHHICCLAAGLLGGGAVFPPVIWGLPRDSFYVGKSSPADEKIPLALGTEPKYIGMIGSRTKNQAIFSHLLARGIPQERLAKVNAPVGLEIKARTPEEIAVSIMAEIIKVRRSIN